MFVQKYNFTFPPPTLIHLLGDQNELSKQQYCMNVLSDIQMDDRLCIEHQTPSQCSPGPSVGGHDDANAKRKKIKRYIWGGASTLYGYESQGYKTKGINIYSI